MDLQPIDVFVARQPIFDPQRRVTGYELLYRASEANSVGAGSADTITSVNLEHTLLSFGLGPIVGDRDAWVNASRTLLLNDHWSMLPPAQTVLEVLETVGPTAEILAACRRAKDHGFRLALDDFAYAPEYEPLLAMADYVKVDFRATAPAELNRLSRDLRLRGVAMLAEKIETEQEFAAAEQLGYSLFQGYFFCRPQVLKTRGVAANRVGFLRLLREVHARELDFDSIEALIEQDVTLSLKLLRFLHTAAFGLGREVSSIRQGLLTLGERHLRKWVSLVAVFGLAQGKPTELVVVALARARFAELIAPAIGLEDRATDLFLTGLLSVVDALTDQTMDEALAPLALTRDVRDALLTLTPPLGDVLALVLAWELGRWDEVERRLRDYGLHEPDLARCYAEAVLWAEDSAQP
jgi:EAL and modified HD-GYP domain-containing signal transduction protein